MSAYNIANMDLFSRVEGGQVVISESGVHRQVDLYKRGDELYAALKDGFARLMVNGGTSVSRVRYKAIEGITYALEFNGPKIVEPGSPADKKLRSVK